MGAGAGDYGRTDGGTKGGRLMAAYEHEHDEWRSALRYATECRGHDYRDDGQGGGTCVYCGDHVSADEL